MVLSELAAATMIAVCGFKNSYRIILKGERVIRQRIRRPRLIHEGYHSFPRSFIRRIFRAGLVIAMRWEGRAKNAAQLAADARLRARRASDLVATRVEQVRSQAEDVRQSAKESAHRVRTTAKQVRQQAQDVRSKAQNHAENIRQRAADVRQRAENVKDAAVAAKNRAVAAKNRVVEISQRVQQRIKPRGDVNDAGRKFSTGPTTVFRSSVPQRRLFHTMGLALLAAPPGKQIHLVRTRFAPQ